MKVRILSGNDTGVVREMEQVEAEQAINTGFGESAEEKVEAKAEKPAHAGVKNAKKKPAAKKVAKKKGRK